VEDTNTSNKMKPSVSMVHSVPELVVTDKVHFFPEKCFSQFKNILQCR